MACVVDRQVVSDNMQASEDSFRTVVKDQDVDEVVANPSFDNSNKKRSGSFSPTVTTAPLLGRDSIRVAFTLEDSKTRGLGNGFGAIFTDVQKKDSAALPTTVQTGRRSTELTALVAKWASTSSWAPSSRRRWSQKRRSHLDNNAGFGLTQKNSNRKRPKQRSDFVVVDD